MNIEKSDVYEVNQTESRLLPYVLEKTMKKSKEVKEKKITFNCYINILLFCCKMYIQLKSEANLEVPDSISESLPYDCFENSSYDTKIKKKIQRFGERMKPKTNINFCNHFNSKS